MMESLARHPAAVAKARAGKEIRRLIRLLPAFALAVATQVQAELPTLGDSSSGIVSLAAERELARAALKEIRAGAPTVDDPILKYYVQLNVLRLAEKSNLVEPALATVLIDSPQINAFAVPGGIVGINLGALSARRGRERVLGRGRP